MVATRGRSALTRAIRVLDRALGGAAFLGLLLSAGCGGGSSPTAPSSGDTGAFFESAGARLHYVLDLPHGAGPFPGVVIGAGSGRTDASDGAAYVPFLLTRGFAVLRYDKRGAGLSTGTYRDLNTANSPSQIGELGGDMAAGAAFLASRPNIAAGGIGLMGTSQAGWVMVAAAARNPDVRFIIAVTGSVIPVGRNIAYEELHDRPIDEAYAGLAAYAGPGGFDPVPLLRSLTIPTLWLFGGDDRFVPTRECRPILAELRASGATTEDAEFPGATHSLPGVSYWGQIDSFLRRHPSH
jgi:uncharacterized protein